MMRYSAKVALKLKSKQKTLDIQWLLIYNLTKGSVLKMIIDGIEVQQHDLSYDKIMKHTLEQSSEMTVCFI